MNFLTLFLVLVLTFSQVLKAEDNLSIAIFNVQKAEESSTKVSSFRKEIEKKQKKYQEEIKKMELEISKSTDNLKKKSSALSSQQLKSEESKIQEEIEKYTKFIQKINAIFDMVKGYGVSDLNTCLSKDVTSIAKTNNVDFVIPSNSVMFASDKAKDITQEVIKAFDKSSCKIDSDAYFKKAEKELKDSK